MIHIIAGKRNSESEKVLQGIFKELQKNSEKGSEKEIERVDASSLIAQNLFDEVQTPSLFGDVKIFVVSGLFENDDAKKLFMEQGKELATAPHDMVVLLDGILAPDVKKVEKFATVQKVVEKADRFAKGAYNPFSLANAFATGDKKKTWIAFQEAIAHDSEMEPLHGMIWWKLKDMVQKKGTGPFSESELRGLARKLVSVYHESRLGGLEMKERLEEFFLTMPSKK